jgi:hypothetical protein
MSASQARQWGFIQPKIICDISEASSPGHAPPTREFDNPTRVDGA